MTHMLLVNIRYIYSALTGLAMLASVSACEQKLEVPLSDSDRGWGISFLEHGAPVGLSLNFSASEDRDYVSFGCLRDNPGVVNIKVGRFIGTPYGDGSISIDGARHPLTAVPPDDWEFKNPGAWDYKGPKFSFHQFESDVRFLENMNNSEIIDIESRTSSGATIRSINAKIAGNCIDRFKVSCLWLWNSSGYTERDLATKLTPFCPV